MKNEDLKEIYNSDALVGSKYHFSSYTEMLMLEQMMNPETWEGKTVLEVGCGPGALSNRIMDGGAASVLGIDFAERMIDLASKRFTRPGLYFQCKDYRELGKKKQFDVLVLQGVLEHLDDPWNALAYLMDRHLWEHGICIMSVPNWTNPFGYVYHTCRILFGLKMTLTDLHYFTPGDFQTFATTHNYKIKFATTDYGRGMGQDMLEDLTHRLAKAGADVIPLLKIQEMIQFLTTTIPFYKPGDFTGATLCMKITKPQEAGALAAVEPEGTA